MYSRGYRGDNTRWGGHWEDWNWAWERMYNEKDNWRGVSTTERNHRVCRCGPRARRSYYHRRRMSSARGYCKELWCWCRLCYARWNVAGHDECEGEVENGKMSFYGMSSEDAQLKHYGKKASHRASEGKKVYIELFHKWHFKPLLKRLEQVEKIDETVLLLGIDKILLSNEDILQKTCTSAYFSKFGFFFREFPSVSKISELLESVIK